MSTFRKPETQASYDKVRLDPEFKNIACPLCIKPTIKQYTFWRSVKNNFPYDGIAQKHDILIPLRHITEDELTEEEIIELRNLKHGSLDKEYKYILEALASTKTIPSHFHLHLIVPLD